MDAATQRLHEQLIRLTKGAIRAWEEWVRVSSGSIELPRRNEQYGLVGTTAKASSNNSASPSGARPPHPHTHGSVNGSGATGT